MFIHLLQLLPHDVLVGVTDQVEHTPLISQTEHEFGHAIHWIESDTYPDSQADTHTFGLAPDNK